MEKGREFWIEESQTNCQWDLLRKRGKWLFWRQKDYYAQENEKKNNYLCQVKWLLAKSTKETRTTNYDRALITSVNSN